MPKDLTVVLEHRPGALAELAEATGRAGINIEGGCGVTSDDRGVIHVLVEDAAATRRALEEAGLEVSDERDVLVVDLEDRPGSLGEVARRLADAGVNVDLLYATWPGIRVVIGADDLDSARAAL
jgi:hypothetical protein